MQIILNTHGLSLTVRKGAFVVKSGEESRQVSPEQIRSIGVTSPCMMSSAAVELAAKAGIPIYFFDETGDAFACLRSPYFESLATLRRKQVYFSDSEDGAAWVIAQFALKTAHQAEVLTYLISRNKTREADLKQLTGWMESETLRLGERVETPSAEWSASLMGWEGSMARKYWQAVSGSLPETFRFSVRSRRPARDAFNALLNYGYGMLYALVEQALFAAGLDPHLGILHVDEYDRPTLAFDLIEPFRPWIDRLIVEMVMEKTIDLSWFEARDEGIWMNTAGKKIFIPRFNGWMEERIRWQGRQMSRTAHIFHSAAELARTIDQKMKRP